MKRISKLRIIGGKWCSRRINFPSLDGVRPTTDMAREMLFNWLAPFISGANCLDLFTGSGILGFEALSRGAGQVVMVDCSKQVLACLRDNAKLLQTKDAKICCAKIPRELHKVLGASFNIVFVDPPFGYNLVGPTCQQLQFLGYLAKDALVYIKAEKQVPVADIIPEKWQILSSKVAGSVGNYLIRN